MANYNTLKNSIQSVIKQNGNNEITGQLLQNALLAIINSLGAGYNFVGVGTRQTVPGTPDYNVFYICGPGYYANFGGTYVKNGQIGVFSYNGTWTYQIIGIADIINNFIDTYLSAIDTSIFDKTQVVSGRGYNVNAGNMVSNAEYGTFAFDVSPDDVILLRGYATSIHPYGYYINNSGGSRVTSQFITGDMAFVVPSGGARCEITIEMQSVDYFVIYKAKLPEIIKSLQQNSNDISEIQQLLFQDIFDKTKIVSGRGYNVNSGTYINNPSMATFTFDVSPGNIIRLSGYSSWMRPYGYMVQNANTNRIASGYINGDMSFNIPATGRYCTITLWTADVDVIKVYIDKTFATRDEIEQQEQEIVALQQNQQNIPFKIKDFADSIRISGYRYLAFFSGCLYNGKEYHVGRDGGSHPALPNYPDTKLVFFEIDANGNRTLIVPNIDYSQINGELRDPNLSVTRDGQYMLLSGFACDINNDSDVIGAYLIIFDKQLNIVKTIDLWQNGLRNVWGNTLETPDGYLLKCSYLTSDGIDYVSLWKSNEKITETLNLTFSKVYDFPTSGLGLNEATIGYVGNKLLFVSRVHNSNSVLAFTETLDGSGGWSQYINLGGVIHSPVIPLYQRGNIFAFGGGYVVSSSIRQPVIVYFDLELESIVSENIIDNTLTGFGGYPSMVEIENNVWAMMYYDDYQNARTAVFYQRVNARYKCALSYIL